MKDPSRPAGAVTFAEFAKQAGVNIDAYTPHITGIYTARYAVVTAAEFVDEKQRRGIRVVFAAPPDADEKYRIAPMYIYPARTKQAAEITAAIYAACGISCEGIQIDPTRVTESLLYAIRRDIVGKNLIVHIRNDDLLSYTF